MDKYLIGIIIFLFVNFAQIQCNSPETSTSMDHTTVSSMLASTATISYSTSVVTSRLTSSEYHGTSSLPLTSNSPIYTASTALNSSTQYSPSSNTINSSIYTVPTTIHSSTQNSPSLNTINSSIHATSMITNAPTGYITSPTSSSPITTQSINVTYNLIYKYNIESSFRLKSGNITNDTILTSVQKMVRSSFNLSDFIITVIRVEIKSQAKATISSDMFVESKFQSSRSNCDKDCISKSTSSSIPTETFKLPAENGSLVDASAKSSPSLIDTASIVTTTTIVNYQNGESPPGLAGRLGMGLGITFIGVLLIVEIIFLYRKYGLNNSSPSRRSDYELPSHNHRLSD